MPAEQPLSIQDIMRPYEQQIILLGDRVERGEFVGERGRKAFMDILLKILRPYYAKTHTFAGRELSRLADSIGFDAIVTDAQGARTTNWFTERQRGLMTGKASRCLACIVVHDDIGVSMSHRNTARVEYILKFIENSFGKVDNPLTVLTANKDEFAQNLMIPEFLIKEATTTVHQAMDGFYAIARRNQQYGMIPAQGTFVLLGGGDYLLPEQVKIVKEAAMRAIEAHSGMNDGKLRGTGRKIFPNFDTVGMSVNIKTHGSVNSTELETYVTE